MQSKSLILRVQHDSAESHPSLTLQRETIVELHGRDLEVVSGGGEGSQNGQDPHKNSP